MNHGFFEIHVFPRVHRVNRRLLVPVVRRGDQHGIHIGARQNLVIIAGGEDGVAPELATMRQPAVVAIGGSHQAYAGHLERHPGVILPLAARADQSQLDLIVCGARRLRAPAPAQHSSANMCTRVPPASQVPPAAILLVFIKSLRLMFPFMR